MYRFTCSGCDECKKDWVDYCLVHGNLVIIKDSDVTVEKTSMGFNRATKSCPSDWLSVKPSLISGLGVWSVRRIPEGVRFGPYQGKLTIPPNKDCSYTWRLRPSSFGMSTRYIDGRLEESANWMRYVNCARNIQEQNLQAFQYRGGIYYRTIKVIEARCELLVFYGYSYARQLGIDSREYYQPIKAPLVPSSYFTLPKIAHQNTDCNSLFTFTDRIFECKFCANRFNNPIGLEEHEAICSKEGDIPKGWCYFSSVFLFLYFS